MSAVIVSETINAHAGVQCTYWYESFRAGSVGVRSQSSAVNTMHSLSSNETRLVAAVHITSSRLAIAIGVGDLELLRVVVVVVGHLSLELERDGTGEGVFKQLFLSLRICWISSVVVVSVAMVSV